MLSTMKKLLCLTASGIFLAGCGGGSDSQVTSPTTEVEQPTSTPQPTIPSPPAQSIAFDRSNLVTFDYTQLDRGQAVSAQRGVSASFANASGSIDFPPNNSSLSGNLTIAVTVSDPDGIKNVFVGFEGIEQKILSACSSNCGTSFHQTITAVNPFAFGISSSSTQQIELWVEDDLENRVFSQSATIHWQPVLVDGLSASRSSGNISLQWNTITNYLRYNVYVTTDESLSLYNYHSVSPSHRSLALTGNSLNITNLDDDTLYYALVVGVDGSGESAFSDPLVINPISGPPNQSPVAVDDQFELLEEQSFSGNLLENDSDPDNEEITVNTEPVVNVENGLLTINSDGSFNYTPPTNFFGTEQFSYRISDDDGLTDEATVTLIIQDVNDPPQAQNNSYNLTDSEQTLAVAAPGLLANDSDIDFDDFGQLRVDVNPVSPPQSGQLTLQENGAFDYQPQSGFNGVVSFSYRVIDAEQAESVATTTITVGGDNSPPEAVNDQYVIVKNASLNTQQDGLNSILANDIDADTSDVVSFVEVTSSVQNGELTVAQDGHFHYVPNTNFYGVDSFNYKISDGREGESIATVTILVMPQNSPPVAVADNYQLEEDSTFSVDAQNGVLSNDTDSDGDTLRVQTLLTSPSHGQLQLQEDGSFSYAPNANFFGTDSFVYSVTDGNFASDTTTVSLSVSNVNDAPVANNDSASTKLNTQVVINVLENDSDLEGDSLSIVEAQANNGTTAINNNLIEYTPAQDFSGDDIINYTISDGNGGTASATVSVFVNGNTAPVAVDDSYSVAEDHELVATAGNSELPGVLDNDSDPDGDTLTVIEIITEPSLGSLSMAVTGSFVYTPTANKFGVDSFVYQLSDGNGGTATATATITIVGSNDAPTGVDDSYTIKQDQEAIFNVLENDFDVDNDTITITGAHGGKGQLTVLDGTAIRYRPPPGFHGEDFFEYNIDDGNGGTAFANVNITVRGPNRPPEAVNDEAATTEDTAITVDVLQNDSDPDGDPLSIVSVKALHGKVQVTEQNKVLYEPDLNFNGNDRIEYTIADTEGVQASAEVFVNVSPVNDDPTPADDNVTTQINTAITFRPLENDSDVDGDRLQISEAVAGQGSVEINSDNSLTYSPPQDFEGTDNINYTVVDNHGGSATAKVLVTVSQDTRENHPPTARDDEASLDEDTQVVINVLGNDEDIDGDPLKVIEAKSEHGQTTILPDNRLEFRPRPDFHGPSRIDYTIGDGRGGQASAKVVLRVININDAPRPVNDSYVIDENQTTLLNVLENDIEVDGDSLKVTFAQASEGEVDIIEQTQLRYTPPTDFKGVIEIRYQVEDSTGLGAEAIASVNIGGVANPPIARDDKAETDEDTPVTVEVLSNDSNGGSGNLSVVSVEAVNGNAKINPNQSVTFTPRANYHGPAEVFYTITNGSGNDRAKVELLVRPVNDPPTANNDEFNVTAGTEATLRVMANDSDIDGDTIRLISAQTETGSVTIHDDVELLYVAPSDFNGLAIINYTITDNHGATASAEASVNVTGGIVLPQAVDDEASTIEDEPITINVLANDSGGAPEHPLRVIEVMATHGAAKINPDHTVTFKPEPNYHGQAVVNYVIGNGNGNDSAKVSITITAVNDAPIAVKDEYRIDEDTLGEFSVLGNDIDVDGDPLKIIAATSNSGQVLIIAETRLEFKPAKDFNGLAKISYTITDPSGLHASTEVAVHVRPINDPPVAVNDNATTDEDTQVTINVLENDSDVDSTDLRVVEVSQNHGEATITDSNTIVFTPSKDFNGTAEFSYTLSDGEATASAAIVVTVKPVNDTPVAQNDSYNLQEDVQTQLSPLDNDSDIDGDELTIIQANAELGTVEINNGNRLSYLPKQDFNGTDKIVYIISDPHGEQAEAAIELNIAAVNDAPSMADAQAEVSEDAENGHRVIILAVTDPDINDTHSFGISSGNDDGAFTISSQSGEITVADTTKLDFDTTPSYSLTVTATDSGNLTATATVTINVIKQATDVTPVQDPDFGNTEEDGITISNAFAFDEDDSPRDAVLDNNGNLIVVGAISNSDISVMRYKPDGSVDQTFGILGRQYFDLLGTETAQAVDVDANGNVYVTGEYNNGSATEIFIIKLNAQGELDDTFGFGGMVFTTFGSSFLAVNDILAHSDGSILLGINTSEAVMILKFTAAGVLENSAIIDFPGSFDSIEAMEQQADGKVILAGHSADPTTFIYDFAVARINTPDSLDLDTSFNGTGTHTFDLGFNKTDMIFGIGLQSQQHIVLVGSILQDSGRFDVAAAVLTPDGVLDSNFGNGGINIYDADGDGGSGSSQSIGKNVDIDAFDNLVIGTQFSDGSVNHDFGAIKTLADGRLDSSFGNGGFARITEDPEENYMVAALLDSQNRPLIVTTAQGSRNQDIAIGRLTTTGVVDTTFRRDGHIQNNVTASNDTLYAGLALKVGSSNGKFLLAGYTHSADNSNTDLIVARYNADGSLDDSFGINGYFYEYAESSGSNTFAGLQVYDAVELSDGRIVLAGSYNGSQAFLLMLTANGDVEPDFGNDGLMTMTTSSQFAGLQAVTQDNNGMIVAGGYQFNDSTDLWLLRMAPDGTADPSFNGTGELILDLDGQRYESVNDIVVLADNSLIFGGYHGSMPLIGKILSNGTLDTGGFNSPTGFQAVDSSGSSTSNFDYLEDLEVNPSGIIYGSGSSSSSPDIHHLLMSVNPDGSLNTAFDSDGIGIYSFGRGDARHSLALDGNGNLLLTGTVDNTTQNGTDVYVARVTPQGVIDPTFNAGAAATFNHSDGDFSQWIHVLDDGRVLIAGFNQDSTDPENRRIWYMLMLELQDACTPTLLQSNAGEQFSQQLYNAQLACR